MSDEEKLYALMAIAEEQQAAAQRAIEGLVAEREKFTQQRALVAKIVTWTRSPKRLRKPCKRPLERRCRGRRTNS